MKQPKKLTRNQKEYLKRIGLEPAKYALSSETDSKLVLYNKLTGLVEVVDKQEKR